MRAFGFLLAVVLLGGCALLQTLEGASVTQSGLDAARAAYDAAFLAPAAHYRQLGFCAAGTAATLIKPCAARAVVAQLAAADKIVETAIAAVQAQITAGNTTGLGASYATLTTAITAAEALAVTLGVH
jgi:hypothetical protein